MEKKYDLQLEEHFILFFIYLFLFFIYYYYFFVLTLFGSSTWTGLFCDCWNIFLLRQAAALW